MIATRPKKSWQRWAEYYARFDTTSYQPDESEAKIGLAQWKAFDSRGIKPEAPSRYFMKIHDGRRWFGYWVEAWDDQRYGRVPDWPGLITFWEDLSEATRMPEFAFVFAFGKDAMESVSSMIEHEVEEEFGVDIVKPDREFG